MLLFALWEYQLFIAPTAYLRLQIPVLGPQLFVLIQKSLVFLSQLNVFWGIYYSLPCDLLAVSDIFL